MEQAADSAGRFSQPPPAGGWKAPPNQLEAHSWETTTSDNLRILAAAPWGPWPAAAVLKIPLVSVDGSAFTIGITQHIKAPG